MPNDIKKLRRLMSAANHLRKENPVILRGTPITASQALKYAWWFEDFRKKLSTGIWRFSYLKKDGSIREAVGTLCMDLIPEDKRPKGINSEALNSTEGALNRAEPAAGVFPYYDLDAAAWRSFRLDNFIGFVEEVKA
jgi:hypothetical protein